MRARYRSDDDDDLESTDDDVKLLFFYACISSARTSSRRLRVRETIEDSDGNDCLVNADRFFFALFPTLVCPPAGPLRRRLRESDCLSVCLSETYECIL